MAKKKITKRKKKLLVPCATSTVLVEPGLRPTDLRTAHGEFTRVDLTPKPKPQNVADAWDAMKEAGELPYYLQHRVNPYRAAPAKSGTEVTRPDIIVTKHPHIHDNGDSAIQWMEHSNHIVTGVCAHCPATFDTRIPEHLSLLRANPRAIRMMGRAIQSEPAGTG